MSCCFCFPNCWWLNETEQLFLDGLTTKKVINGPSGCTYVGCCWGGGKRKAITLKKTEYLKVHNEMDGSETVITGDDQGLVFLGPHDSRKPEPHPLPGYNLGPLDYLKVLDTQTSERRIEKGIQLFFPGPYDTVEAQLKALELMHNQYVKIIDNRNGKIRVERGEAQVFLSPTEDVLDVGKSDRGIKNAVNVDEHTAVLVRDTLTGKLFLETTTGLFFPNQHQSIEEVQEKIVLEDHQVVILIDKNGKYIFKEGRAAADIYTDEGLEEEDIGTKSRKKSRAEKPAQEKARSFFLPPYCKLVELEWFTSEDLEHKKETVTHFDLRPQFMTYEFVCRTTDNVELIVDLTFFWEINDVRLMVHKTDDLPSDICNHARSIIIQEVSQTTLEKFMKDFNQIISSAVLEQDDPFYDERGCKVHTVEVRSIHCKDVNTEKVLQEIIKETTDRLNRLQKATSENEVKLRRMRGDIEEEKLNGELLAIRHDHHRAEAQMQGEAEADQVRAFVSGLKKVDVPFKDQLDIWHSFRKLDGIRDLAKTKSHMFFTPQDVNLSIETLGLPPKAMKKLQ